MIKFTIITLFREALEPYLQSSMMEKAVRKGLAEFDFYNIRKKLRILLTKCAEYIDFLAKYVYNVFKA